VVNNLHGHARRLVLEPGHILFCVGSIDDDQPALSRAIDEGVVDNASIRIAHGRVRRVPVLEPLYVGGDQRLQECHRVSPAHHDSAHVREIEKAGSFSDPPVLLDRACRIAQGHLPARKGGHPGAQRQMLAMQGRALVHLFLSGVSHGHASSELSRYAISRLASSPFRGRG